MSSIRTQGGSRVYNPLLQPDLKMMLAENDELGLQQFCEVLNPVIVAEVLQGMEPSETWRVLSSTGIEQHQLTWRVSQVIVAAQYQRDTHQRIVDGVREKERCAAVGTTNNKVADVVAHKTLLAMHYVFKGDGLASWHAKTNGAG